MPLSEYLIARQVMILPLKEHEIVLSMMNYSHLRIAIKYQASPQVRKNMNDAHDVSMPTLIV